MLYFAYGSNLNVDRLTERCGLVQKITNYTLKDYKLVFNTGSYRSFASVVYSEGDEVEGVLYQINKKQEKELDRHEGVGWGQYEKEYFIYENQIALMYVGLNMSADYAEDGLPAKPDSYYLEVIIKGCKQHGLTRTQKQLTELLIELYPYLKPLYDAEC